MKKALILYDSIYGNTKKVAMSLSRGLEAGGIYVDCYFIQDLDLTSITNYDVIGIGGPTHFHGASKPIKSFLKKIYHIKIEKKYAFAFETKADFKLAGSSAKRITRYLKKMKMKIVHPPITGIVLDKEGPLKENTSDVMEQIGLRISDKLNNNVEHKNNTKRRKESKISKRYIFLNRIKWILLAGGPLFFFIRALYMASTGGDCFGTINPFSSWFLLITEIIISGIAGFSGIIGLLLWIKGDKQRIILKKINLPKIVLFAGFASYTIHFVRVAIWISLCVI
ncbi:MAG: flavodoxin domain-containing protein [Promethearchaeota archaeon]